MVARQTIPNKLPEFTGNPINWRVFYNEFINTTQICNFSNYENITRLRESLSGKARDSVHSLLIFPSNVPIIIEILKERFGCPQFIVQKLIERIKNIPPVREDKFENFIKFYDSLTSLIYTLTSQQPDHIRDASLFEEVLNKIPCSQRISFLQHYKDLPTANRDP